VANKNKPIFGGIYFQGLLEIIFSGYFRRCLLKCEIRQKLFGPIFSSYAQAAEIITDLFSVVFHSRRKLLYTKGSTHPHFNYTAVLNWKITHTHNYTYIQSFTIISSIQHSHPLISIHIKVSSIYIQVSS
jgi:hypothetical protein